MQSKKKKEQLGLTALYCRLSRDDGAEGDSNSVANQRRLLQKYAKENSLGNTRFYVDDGHTGTNFNRSSFQKMIEDVEMGLCDSAAVVVKDLSRLGRHKTQTARFIDYLREHDVRVLSVTENIDTSNEDDELMVGFKGIFNDMYCRDISKKIRAGYKQKQKQGIVMIPPMGYFKDKNTGEVVIVEEQAAIVRRIFDLYISGYGIKAIAKILNAEGIKSQGFYQQKLLGKKLGDNKPEIARRFLWENTGVKRLLQNEFYCGTLVCHRSYTSKINHIRKELPKEEQYRHENAVPAIISREKWEQAQFLLRDNVERNVRAGQNSPHHRYTGLIKCGDCGSSFVCRKRVWRDNVRYEYTCNGYHRYGKENCTAHRIDESTLDKLIYDELIAIKEEAETNYRTIETDVKSWLAKKNTSEKRIKNLTDRLAQRKSDPGTDTSGAYP